MAHVEDGITSRRGAAHARLSARLAQLSDYEARWRDRYHFLRSKGYTLRPRYHPEWVPSWLGSDILCYGAEDSITLPFRPNLTDVTRLSVGRLVYIKRVESGSQELAIALMFSQNHLRDNPANHCVPILDSFEDDEDPAISYLVMPFLRLMDDPPFWLVNDVVDFVDQMLEGLAYMHAHGVAHRDNTRKNLMMDASALYPHGFHPVWADSLPNLLGRAKPLPRLSTPVKYYYVDFGLSVHIPSTPDSDSAAEPKRAEALHEPKRALVLGEYGQDQDVPELSSIHPYDPFKVDIYILGNVFRKEIYAKYSNAKFLLPLIKSMTSFNPEDRPDAATALRQWRQLRGRILLLHRGWRVRERSENVVETVLFDVVHFVRLGILLSRILLVWTSQSFALVRHIS